MKTSGLVLVICATLGIGSATDLTKEQYDKWKQEWRKTLCEENDDALIRELETCDKFDPHGLNKVFHDCYAEAFPESEDAVEFMKAACTDEKIFETYDNCMKPHVEDETFLKQVLESEEGIECYVEIMVKHGLFTDGLKLKVKK